MKYIEYIFIFLLMSSHLCGQGIIDTNICADNIDDIFFETPYDSLLYDSEWYHLEELSPFSIDNSVQIIDPDTLVLFGLPNDMTLDTLRDTFAISLKVTPIISLDIPSIDCFVNDTLVFNDNSTIYGDYTIITYDDDNGNEENYTNSQVSWPVENGENIIVTANYSIPDCSISIDTSFSLATQFTPISDFEIVESCFGDSTLIVNNSLFDPNVSSFSLSIEDINQYSTALDSYQFVIPENGVTKEVVIEINQSGCIVRDTLQVSSLLKPEANFDVENSCENESLIINNLSGLTTAVSSYDFEISNTSYSFNNLQSFILPDTFPDGDYNIQGIVNNGNGCLDTMNFPATIDFVTYVSLSNLASSYCQFEESEVIEGSENGGTFTGLYITDFGNGTAIFNPQEDTSNISITYSFTNNVFCTDQVQNIIDTIYATPQLNILGLDSTYCELEEAVILSVDQILSGTSSFLVEQNGQFFDSENSSNYLFDPIEEGQYTIIYTYEDSNGCGGTIINETVVNPNPSVELDSLILITPGQNISIGNILTSEPNVLYEWSNGSTQANIDVDQPGIYVVFGIDILTGCMKNDTARVEFDALIEEALYSIQISPNPTSDFVTIQLGAPAQGIRIMDVFGVQITIDGLNSFSTDNNGSLEIDLSNQNLGYYYLIVPSIGNFLLLKA